MGRMIANLFEPQHCGKDQPLTRDALRLLYLLQHLVDHSLIERGLLASKVTEDLVVDLVGQILDNRPIGLESSQNEGLHQTLESSRPGIVLIALNRNKKALAKLRRATQIAGVEKLHD